MERRQFVLAASLVGLPVDGGAGAAPHDPHDVFESCVKAYLTEASVNGERREATLAEVGGLVASMFG